jgi:catechol 2,3-dioxygenase-like lactoylglutathione lyase family enzyme
VPTRAPAITVAGYSHVAIMVDDLDAALAFYCDTLGFAALPRPDFGPGARGAWLQLGTAQVHLGIVDEMGARAGFPHMALHIPADAWGDTMAGIEARGIEFLLPPSERLDFGTPVRAAFIRDPAGNVIELTDVDPT